MGRRAMTRVVKIGAVAVSTVLLLIFGVPYWFSTNRPSRRMGKHEGIGEKYRKMVDVLYSDSSDKEPISTNDKPLKLKERIVHFDLKGAPLRVAYFKRVFPLLRRAGATGILMEYEDMLPYDGQYRVLRNGYAYSQEDVQSILAAAGRNDLTVIPLVQTLGHMEWMLKHKEFSGLREVARYPQVISPCNPNSLVALKGMLDEVVAFHKSFGLKTFHMGADEAFYVGHESGACYEQMEKEQLTKYDIMLQHVTHIARYLKEKHGIERVLMWHDMIKNANIETLKRYEVAELIEPVIWKYSTDVTLPNSFPSGFFQRFGSIFPHLWAGSSFKGANGPTQTFIEPNRYLSNHVTWLNLISNHKRELRNKFQGVILTGWQRFDHFAALCELFPEGTISLVVNLLLLRKGIYDPSFKDLTRETLNCTHGGDFVKRYARKVDKLLKLAKKDTESEETLRQMEKNLRLPFGIADCYYPGAAVFNLNRQLNVLRTKYQLIESTHWNKGWLAPYNLNHRYSSVYFAEKYYNLSQKLTGDMINLGGKYRNAFQGLFFDETINEWLYSNIQWYIDELNSKARFAMEIMNTIDFRNRPLSREKLEF